MKKVTLITGLAALAVAAYGVHLEVNNAWARAMTVDPTDYDPKTLANNSHQLEYPGELTKIYHEDDWWYYWIENVPKDYDIMIFSFNQVDPTRATLRWQLETASTWYDIILYYWDGTGNPDHWVEIDSGEGYVEYTDVLEAFDENPDAENVTFMCVGYTPGEYELWIGCDVFDIQYVP